MENEFYEFAAAHFAWVKSEVFSAAANSGDSSASGKLPGPKRHFHYEKIRPRD